MSNPIRDRIATLADNFTAGIAADRICDQFIIIDRSELPKVKTLELLPGGRIQTFTERSTSVHELGDSLWALSKAREYIALSEHLKEAAAVEKLNQRRDEVALEFTADTRGTLSGACNYAGLLPWTRKMVDRIIELEQAQS